MERLQFVAIHQVNLADHIPGYRSRSFSVAANSQTKTYAFIGLLHLFQDANDFIQLVELYSVEALH